MLIQVLENHYITHPQDKMGVKLLPHTNLPLHLPTLAQQSPHYFGGKDPHLLKPPVVLSAAGGFGRRASGIVFTCMKIVRTCSYIRIVCDFKMVVQICIWFGVEIPDHMNNCL